MFIDQVNIEVVAGNGGKGMVAFRREKYVPKGGPSGGNGGKGGSIIFRGSLNKTTLLDLKYNKIIKADSGENGKAKDMFGKDALDIIIEVPLGTVVKNLETGEVIADITKENQEVVIARGGKGGRGNAAFATSKNPAPRIFEAGERGEVKNISLELKLLADAGLVGLPNVGKSTIISALSKARPKIADYPFTTLIPNLGMVEAKDGRSFVLADLPGLIEGASLGAGLGHDFLRHIERCRIIIYVLDVDPLDKSDPYENYLLIKKELEEYNPELITRPEVIVANKMDLPNANKNLLKLKTKLGDDVIGISAYQAENLDALVYRIADLLDTVPLKEEYIEEVVEYTFKKEEKPYTITILEDGVYEVKGKILQRYIDSTNFDNDESVKLLSYRLKKLGIEDELKKLGVSEDDTVIIEGIVFEIL